MQQQKSDYTLWTEHGGGHVFLHIEVRNWSPSVYRQIGKEILELVEDLYLAKVKYFFATSDKEKSVKFWKMFAELEDLDKFGPNKSYWIGSWYVEDALNGLRKSFGTGNPSSQHAGAAVSRP